MGGATDIPKSSHGIARQRDELSEVRSTALSIAIRVRLNLDRPLVARDLRSSIRRGDVRSGELNDEQQERKCQTWQPADAHR